MKVSIIIAIRSRYCLDVAELLKKLKKKKNLCLRDFYCRANLFTQVKVCRAINNNKKRVTTTMPILPIMKSVKEGMQKVQEKSTILLRRIGSISKSADTADEARATSTDGIL